MSVLVLAGDRDPAVDAVVDDLLRRGVAVFRCDTAWFPTRLSLEVLLHRSSWAGYLRTDYRSVPLADIGSVWYRTPTAFVLPDGLSPAERRHAAWEAKFGLGGVLAEIDAVWMNHPHREADLGFKPGQLSRATACGLAVPPSLITNRPEAVLEFAQEHDHDIVVKPLAFNSVTEDGVTSAIYTHALNKADLADLAGVSASAHFFQKRVPKEFEVRLTMVGGEPFAAAIHAGSDVAAVDWRTDLAHVRLTTVDVPGDVLDGVSRFMDAFGITFGAFDFAVTPHHEWIMFECNGAGQFGFVETATGLPITAAVSALLGKGNR